MPIHRTFVMHAIKPSVFSRVSISFKQIHIIAVALWISYDTRSKQLWAKYQTLKYNPVIIDRRQERTFVVVFFLSTVVSRYVFRLWTQKRHPIHRPHGRLIGSDLFIIVWDIGNTLYNTSVSVMSAYLTLQKTTKLDTFELKTHWYITNNQEQTSIKT